MTTRTLEGYEYDVEEIYRRVYPQTEVCPEKGIRPNCVNLSVNDMGLKKGALPVCKFTGHTCEMLVLKRSDQKK